MLMLFESLMKCGMLMYVYFIMYVCVISLFVDGCLNLIIFGEIFGSIGF